MDWRFYRITGRRKKLEEEEEGGEEQPTGREDSERMGEERMGENGRGIGEIWLPAALWRGMLLMHAGGGG